MIFCDPSITISTNLLLIFVCVPHQLEINIMWDPKSIFNFLRFFERTLYKSNYIIFISS